MTIPGIGAVALGTLLMLAGLPMIPRGASDENPAAEVTIDPSNRLQPITGWEATTFAFQTSPAWQNFSSEVFDRAVWELGLNRVRLEVRSGSENARDYWTEYMNGSINYTTWRSVRYSTMNDDADPNTLNAAGFHFSEMDWNIENIVAPLKKRVESRGERLWINLNYVAFTGQIGQGLKYEHNDTKEYAEFVLATQLHTRQKYGWVPDTWEVILEPDNVAQWRSGTQIGKAIVDSAARLQAAGMRPRFVAPSDTNMANAIAYFDDMVKVNGVLGVLEEFSYHRYGGVSDQNLREIGNRSVQHKVNTSHLEHIGSGHGDLHKDLKIARNSAWAQFVLAGGGSDDGGKYYLVDDSNPANPVVSMGSRTKFLWHYFHFVRAGAQVVASTSSFPRYDPVAFVNPNGTNVVVIDVEVGGPFAVAGLAAGKYGMVYTTSGQHNVSLGTATIAAGERLNVSMPSGGLLTIYGIGGGGGNSAPAVPQIAGPATGQVSQTLAFDVVGTDPDTDQVKYTVDWGGSATSTSPLVASGTKHSMSHSWAAKGTYQVRARSTDAKGAVSGWSPPLSVTISDQVSNRPPDVPAVTGPATGKTGSLLAFTVSAADPDNDQVKYTIAWGDTATDTSSLVASGTPKSMSHAWTSPGAYVVKAKTTDALGLDSGWSAGINVVVSDQGGNDTVPPVIVHDPVLLATEGKEVKIEAKVTDAGEIASVSLHFRPGGGSSFTVLPMPSQGGDSYAATIPGAQVVFPTVEYYLEARDVAGNVATHPAAGSAAPHVIDVGREGAASNPVLLLGTVMGIPILLVLVLVAVAAVVVATLVLLRRRKGAAPAPPQYFSQEPGDGPAAPPPR